MALRTPLYDAHVEAGGRIVEFGGFDMPVQYSGVSAEHHAVRNAVGLFDVSHMGEVFFEGPDALGALNRLVTNDLRALKPGRAQYNTICNERGGIVDDTVVYRVSETRLLVCVNAANRAKDFAWLSERAEGDVRVTDASDDWAQLAVQGPRWGSVVGPLCDVDLERMAPFSLVHADVAGIPAIVATTGYTGEAGVEIFCPAGEARGLWDALRRVGGDHGLLPCGLGARDSLRLEAKLCLYGHDIDDSTTPYEAGLGWVVKPDSGEFVGREALLAQKAEGIPRRLVGFEVTGRGIARHGYAITQGDGVTVGRVTSGTMSPTLGKAVGLGYVPWSMRKSGTELAVDVRGREVSATVVKGAFYRRRD